MTEHKISTVVFLKAFLFLKVNCVSSVYVTIMKKLAFDGEIVGEQKSASVKITQVKANKHMCEVKLTFSRTETGRWPKHFTVSNVQEWSFTLLGSRMTMGTEMIRLWNE